MVDSIDKLVNKDKFSISTVNIPLAKEQKQDNYNILNKFNYSFKKLFANNKSIADSLGVVYYPTTIAIKNGQVIFRGDFEEAVQRFKLLQ